MLASSTSLSLCQIFCSPLLLPAVKNKAVYVCKPLHSPAGSTLKGTLLISEGERQCRVQEVLTHEWALQDIALVPAYLIKDQQMRCVQQASLPRMGAPGPCPPGQGGHHSSPDQFLHFHSTTRSSSRIPVPKKQRNSLNKWSKHSRLIISCKEQAQESTLAYHHTEIWPTSPACHWQPFFFPALFLVKHNQLESATVSSKLWATKIM